jgi:DNA-binding NtrC family response regulator
LESTLVRQALARSGGNLSEAARLLGVSRNGLVMKMQRLGIDR